MPASRAVQAIGHEAEPFPAVAGRQAGPAGGRPRTGRRSRPVPGPWRLPKNACCGVKPRLQALGQNDPRAADAQAADQGDQPAGGMSSDRVSKSLFGIRAVQVPSSPMP